MTKSTTDLKKDLVVQERTVKLRELLEKKWKELPNNIGVGRFYIKLKPDDFEEAGFENIHSTTCLTHLENPPNDCNCTGQLRQYNLQSQYEIYQCRSCGQYLGALTNRDLGYTLEDRNDWQRWKQQCFTCYQNFDKKTDDEIQKLNRKAKEIETNLITKIEDAIVILNKHTGSIDELNNGFDNEKNENRLDELEAKIDELNDIGTGEINTKIAQLEASMRIVAQTEHACESEDEDSPIATAHNRLDKIGENLSAILERLEAIEDWWHTDEGDPHKFYDDSLILDRLEALEKGRTRKEQQTISSSKHPKVVESK